MTTSTRRTNHVDLPAASPGTESRLKVIRYGESGARPKVYMQSSLHADEIPGMLAMIELDRMLREADQQGNISGEVLLVPVANPVGLGQTVHGHLAGRFDLVNGVNFNRNYPDLTSAVARRVEHQLGSSAEHNVRLIRKTIGDVIGEHSALDQVGFMRSALFTMAVDSDICLDLHCDSEAALHLYVGTPLWPEATDLAAQLGSQATLLAEISGGNPFDEAVGGIWWALARRYPDYPIPPACLSATVELRGERQVSRAYARQDARNLFRFLVRRGAVDGDPGPLPALVRDATPLDAVDPIKAPHAGVVVYCKAPGDLVASGETVAEVIDPWSEQTDTGTPLRSRASGILFSRQGERFTRAGQVVCRVAGTEPLADRVGRNLLSD